VLVWHLYTILVTDFAATQLLYFFLLENR